MSEDGVCSLHQSGTSPYCPSPSQSFRSDSKIHQKNRILRISSPKNNTLSASKTMKLSLLMVSGSQQQQQEKKALPITKNASIQEHSPTAITEVQSLFRQKRFQAVLSLMKISFRKLQYIPFLYTKK